MRTLLIPASCGLLLGMSLSAARLISPDGLRDTLRFRPSHALKATLWALGTAIAAMALLCWLAVMDIDRIVPLPLHAGTLAGGMLFGVCAALCGFTPGTALAGIASRKPMRALCAALGCLAGAWLVQYVPTEAVRGLWEAPAGTLFRMTLTEPYWFGGGFLRQGCVGLALMLLGLLMPSGVRWTRQIPPEKPTESAEPETFVALLPGEEPMVVEIPAEDAEIDDELHHLPPEDEVEEIDGSPEEENPDEPTGILPDEENMETETLEIDDELHHLPPEDEVEETD